MTDTTPIDLLITYVNNTNDDWLAAYQAQNVKSYPQYFRTGNNALKYLLRSVDENLPFINQVFLVVQNASEVPNYVDTSKVHVVTHSEFIPAEYLPTFNSVMIESFFGNIEGLSEHFLYMCDDFFILNELSKSDFYTSDDKAISYWQHEAITNGARSGYQEMLIRSSTLIFGITRENAIAKGSVLKVNHTIRPYLKSVYSECYDKFHDEIAPTLTRFRSSKNYSIDIVDGYHNMTGKAINNLTIRTIVINNNMTDTQLQSALGQEADILCIGDIDENVDIYENPILTQFLQLKFTSLSRYEKEVD